MWKYFPRLPTKEAWENRTFNDSLTIELVLKQLALHDNYLRGQVLFKLKRYRTIQFNSVKGLKYSLKEERYGIINIINSSTAVYLSYLIIIIKNSIYKIIQSMSRVKNCWDNAVAESFFKTLKVERVYHRKYMDEVQSKSDLFQYIEIFYNRKRLHSSLNYTNPVDYKKKYLKQIA